MSEFVDWRDDLCFINSEAVKLPITVPGGFDAVIAIRVWWLQPPGKRSTRVSIDVPLLSDDKLTIEQRNMVAGWRCSQCKTVLFGTCIDDLQHSPCCGEAL
jgi:hypothetical protein